MQQVRSVPLGHCSACAGCARQLCWLQDSETCAQLLPLSAVTSSRSSRASSRACDALDSVLRSACCVITAVWTQASEAHLDGMPALARRGMRLAALCVCKLRARSAPDVRWTASMRRMSRRAWTGSCQLGMANSISSIPGSWRTCMPRSRELHSTLRVSQAQREYW